MMRVSILTTQYFHDCKEVTRIIDGKQVRGRDKIIFGGSERYTIDLYNLLTELGCTVTVYQPFPGINQPFSKQYKGITFVMIPNRGGWEYNTCTDLNWQFNELTALDDMRIYMAQYLAWPNAVSPCITISHGIYWDNIQGNNIIKNLTEEQRKEFFKRQLYGFTQADACVAVDSNVRKVLQAMESGLEKRVHVIYNYVDTQKFYPGQKTWEGTNILFPRRLTVLRGSTEVTKAFINLPQYNFTLAGQAHDDKAAQAFFKAHEHRKNVQFIHREMDDMPEVYQNADISLVPTISTEGLSLSLLESMASGLPVITTPVGGLGDAVIPGYNALIYDPHHDDICDYITALAEDKETCEKFGKRNREIAVECFDREIWKARWKALLSRFGIVPEKQYSTTQPHKTADYAQKYDAEWVGETTKRKPKLVAMMLTHNESGRYLGRVIENTLLFCDEIVIVDDHSTDETVKVLRRLEETTYDKENHQPRLFIATHPHYSWENENKLRMELMNFAKTRNPDWLIAIDSDELYEAEMMNIHLPYIMAQDQADYAGFRFYDMWDDEQHYRDDDIWPAGNGYAPRMFRVKPGMEYTFVNSRRHCGSVPVEALLSPCLRSPVRVKHLGWMKPEDRKTKYLDRMCDDPDNEFFPEEVYDAILDDHPTLVKWDDNNLWQTSKLTIAYPPGMEWNIMQQRPHHLLKLAASERYRVFFGDDSAPGIYEPVPYLTVVKDWGNIKEVDVLYVTSPAQMERCKHIKYKKLIYDCCDWQNEMDLTLIEKANFVLFASRSLYLKHAEIWQNGGSYKDILPTGYHSLGDFNEDLECAIMKRFTKKAIYLPNACEYDHFAETPDPLPGTPEPIIGYMGCIHPTMIDEKIINALAEKYKVLVIGQNKGIEFTHPNIYATGHVHYSELPRYLANCTVGIIPFRTDSDYLRYSAPIKVYEYLSAGRPVVATPIPELIPLADANIIRVVENDDLDGWVKAVADAIKGFPDSHAKEYASRQTWIERWNTFKKECLEL